MGIAGLYGNGKALPVEPQALFHRRRLQPKIRQLVLVRPVLVASVTVYPGLHALLRLLRQFPAKMLINA